MSSINLRRRAIKQQIIAQNRLHANDTGSVELQIVLNKNKLFALQQHQTKHPKDITIKRTIACIKAKISKFQKYLNK